EWLSLEFDCDMTSNTWEILLNGNSLGTFSSASNQLGSIDFFPYNAASNGGNNISGYYIDDISYEYTPYTPLPLDAALFTVDVSALGLTGQEKNVSGSIINLGTTSLSSFDLEWSYGTASGTENISGVNVANLETYDFAFAAPITLIEGTNGLQIDIVNVNASVDDDQSNNDGTTMIQAVTPTPDKVVVAEEATGTWCGWCPRGAVFLEYMHENYEGYFAGIAVHNGDPMTVDAYDQGFGASSFPNLQVERTGWVDPSSVELGFISRIQEDIDGTISLDATYAAGQISVEATVNAINELDGYRLAVVLIENNVTGSGSGWAQANYYSGGTTVMGGYENLPDPVPAADMVYHEVARAILGGANGMALGTLSPGGSESQSFSYSVPADEEANQMKAIGILFEPNGQINNGGYLDLSAIVGIEEQIESQIDLNLFPNPSNEFANLSMNLEDESHVSIQVTDLTGKNIYAKDYGQIRGQYIFPIQTAALANGTYIVQIEVNGVVIPRKLAVQR
ncbi:MAG: Omp28-related outer membrane protein, partial [Bacteroidota bacterium]